MSEYGNADEDISDNGKHKCKRTLPAVTKAPNNSAAVFSRGRKHGRHDAHAKGYHHYYPNSQSGYRKHPMSAYDNQSQ